jgi:hypothetical protein
MIEFVLACMISSYHIGNSLTMDGLGNNPTSTLGIEHIANKHNQDLTIGYHGDSSQSLNSIWDNPNGVGTDGINWKRSPYDDYTNALTNYAWDVVLLQPYLGQLSTYGQDKTAIDNFINLTNNTDTIVYIYQVWPWQSQGEYREFWNSESVNNDLTPTRAKRQYYTNLMEYLHDTYTPNGIVVRQVPTGEVWYKIAEAIHNGDITEISMVNMYGDDIHASSNIGRYTAAATVYSTLFRIPVTELPELGYFNNMISLSSLVEKINKIIWEVVSNDRYSGVGDFNDDGYVDAADLLVWQDTGTSGRDFLHWQRNFHQNTPSILAIPEPSTLYLVSVLLPLFMKRS